MRALPALEVGRFEMEAGAFSPSMLGDDDFDEPLEILGRDGCDLRTVEYMLEETGRPLKGTGDGSEAQGGRERWGSIVSSVLLFPLGKLDRVERAANNDEGASEVWRRESLSLALLEETTESIECGGK